jgi:aminoglycoside phosphotransferase (APT) family kinase protein
VLIDDAVLPAASHLTGPAASEVLGATVAAAGGRLHSARACHVQYRPGSDLVVRYAARVSWGGRADVDETLVASTSVHGALPGSVPVVADTADGPLEVGVWRWPFDPILTGLADAVTPTSARRFVGQTGGAPVRLEVVAYRPTERAVISATTADGTVYYLKVIPPASALALAERHDRLRAARVPVPEAVRVDPQAGVITMAELAGETLRQRLKAGVAPWPDAAAFIDVCDALAEVDLPGATPVRSRVADAIGHAAMLATVLPDQRPRLERICDVLETELGRVRAGSAPTIHGDLYEAQIITDGDRITGILDIDDVGPGDPLDDRATVLGHLRYRAATAKTKDGSDRLRRYADALRHGFAAGHDAGALDLHTGAVLVGLATGPFRVQQHHWRHEVRRQLGLAERLVVAGRRDNALVRSGA